MSVIERKGKTQVLKLLKTLKLKFGLPQKGEQTIIMLVSKEGLIALLIFGSSIFGKEKAYFYATSYSSTEVHQYCISSRLNYEIIENQRDELQFLRGDPGKVILEKKNRILPGAQAFSNTFPNNPKCHQFGRPRIRIQRFCRYIYVKCV